MADPSTREPHKNPIKRLMETTWQVTRPLAETLAETPEGARICDVGAGGRRVRPDAVCVDITAGPNVDVVADSHDLPLESGTFDLFTVWTITAEAAARYRVDHQAHLVRETHFTPRVSVHVRDDSRPAAPTNGGTIAR